jgi:hypothetical protein
MPTSLGNLCKKKTNFRPSYGFQKKVMMPKSRFKFILKRLGAPLSERKNRILSLVEVTLEIQMPLQEMMVKDSSVYLSCIIRLELLLY